MKNTTRQSRLTIREQEYRDKIIYFCWLRFKKDLTMEEMANIFRMPLAQFYKIVKRLQNKKNG